VSIDVTGFTPVTVRLPFPIDIPVVAAKQPFSFARVCDSELKFEE